MSACTHSDDPHEAYDQGILEGERLAAKDRKGATTRPGPIYIPVSGSGVQVFPPLVVDYDKRTARIAEPGEIIEVTSRGTPTRSRRCLLPACTHCE